MELQFTEDGWKDYSFWHKHDNRVLKRINRLIEDIQVSPFVGLGKPEPLKHDAGCWSRRIDLEHRLVYYIKDEEIWVLSCRGHYG